MRIQVPLSFASLGALTLLACDPTPPITAATPAAQRIASYGSNVYDISIGSITALDTFHDSYGEPLPPIDKDYVYFSVVDTDSAGNVVFQGNYNDGSNYYGDLMNGKTVSNGNFVIPQVPLLAGDTVTIAFAIDSRSNPVVQTAFAPWQQNEVNFMGARALARATGQRTDTEALPWTLDDGVPVDGNNFPLWVDNYQSGLPLPQFNGALGQPTPAPANNCDGYVMEGFVQVPAAQIIGGAPYGQPRAVTSLTKLSDAVIVCFSDDYPAIANKMANTTITFNSVWSQVPYPPLGQQCNVSGLSPVITTSLFPPNNPSFIGQWRDPTDTVEAVVSTDAVSGFDATASEKSCSFVGFAPLASSATRVNVRTNGITPYGAPFCPHIQIGHFPPLARPANEAQSAEAAPAADEREAAEAVPASDSQPAIINIPIFTYVQTIYLSNNVALELYRQTCSNSGATGAYQLRYLRTDANGTPVTDFMMQRYTPIY